MGRVNRRDNNRDAGEKGETAANESHNMILLVVIRTPRAN
jgi:hypothetical protein